MGRKRRPRHKKNRIVTNFIAIEILHNEMTPMNYRTRLKQTWFFLLPAMLLTAGVSARGDEQQLVGQWQLAGDA